MRTTITIDDQLLDDAMELTDIKEKSALLNHALRTLVHLEASRRLASLGGSQPDLAAPPRRRIPTQ